MDALSFADALDGLIGDSYVERLGMWSSRPLHPRHSEVMERVDFIVDEVDSPEHRLLRAFDLTRRELLRRPVSPWSDPGEVSGEITDAK